MSGRNDEEDGEKIILREGDCDERATSDAVAMEKWGLVQFDFEASTGGDDELSVFAGEKVVVLRKLGDESESGSEWLQCRNMQGEEGCVPTLYVQTNGVRQGPTVDNGCVLTIPICLPLPESVTRRSDCDDDLEDMLAWGEWFDNADGIVEHGPFPFESRLECWDSDDDVIPVGVDGELVFSPSSSTLKEDLPRIPMDLLCEDEVVLILLFLQTWDRFVFGSVSSRYRQISSADHLWKDHCESKAINSVLLRMLGSRWRSVWLQAVEDDRFQDEEVFRDYIFHSRDEELAVEGPLSRHNFFRCVLAPVKSAHMETYHGRERPSTNVNHDYLVAEHAAMFSEPVPEFESKREEWIAKVKAPFQVMRDFRPAEYQNPTVVPEFGDFDHRRSCASKWMVGIHVIWLVVIPVVVLLMMIVGLVSSIVGIALPSIASPMNAVLLGVGAVSTLLCGSSILVMCLLHEGFVTKEYYKRIKRSRRLTSLISDEILATFYFWWKPNVQPRFEFVALSPWSLRSKIGDIRENRFFMGRRIAGILLVLGECCAFPTLACSIGAAHFVNGYSIVVHVSFFALMTLVLIGYYVLHRRHVGANWGAEWSFKRLFFRAFVGAVVPVWFACLLGLIGGNFKDNIGPSAMSFGGVFILFLLTTIVFFDVFIVVTVLLVSRSGPQKEFNCFVRFLLCMCNRNSAEAANDDVQKHGDSSSSMAVLFGSLCTPCALLPLTIGAILLFFGVSPLAPLATVILALFVPLGGVVALVFGAVCLYGYERNFGW